MLIKSQVILFFILFCSISLSSQKAMDFTITDSEGNIHHLYSDYLDQNKVAVIKLFFVACPLCKPSNEPFQALYEEFGSGQEEVEFFMLSTKDWDTNDEVAEYLVQYGLTFPAAGADGGAKEAVDQFRNGTYGTYYGDPVFIAIEPDGTVHFDLDGEGTTGTMNVIRNTVNEILGNQEEMDETIVEVDVLPYGNESLAAHKLYLRSSDDPMNKYEVPATFTYPSENYPALNNPQLYVEFIEKNYGGVTTFDIFTIQRFILGLSELNNLQIIASDVNGSDSVTAADLLSMRKLILSVVDDLPVGSSYFAINIECESDMAKCVQFIPIDTSLLNQQITFRTLKYGDVR